MTKTTYKTTTGLPIIGNTLNMVFNANSFLTKQYETLGPVFKVNLPGYGPLILLEPELIGHVLEKQHQHFKKNQLYEHLKLALGNGLLTNEGESWKKMRKTIQPYIYESVIEQFLDTMMTHSDTLTKKWLKKGKEINISTDIKHTTLDIASETFFGINARENIPNFVSIANKLSQLILYKSIFPFNSIPYSWPIFPNNQIKNNIAVINTLINDLTSGKYKTGNNMLELLLSNPNLSIQQVRDEIITFLTAGYETTAHTLIFTLALLGLNPKIQDDIYDEIKNQPLIKKDFKLWKKKYPLLCATINESLRLYPPAFVIGRESINSVTINNIQLAPKTNIGIPVSVLHRLERFWDKPNSFNPKRFIDNTPEKYTFIPFGAGPRVCIGQQFAMLEMIIILYQLISETRFKLNQSKIKSFCFVTTTPLKPLSMSLYKR